jgi:hypothetical protein
VGKAVKFLIFIGYNHSDEEDFHEMSIQIKKFDLAVFV